VDRDLPAQPGAFGDRNRQRGLGRDRRCAFDVTVAERSLLPGTDGEDAERFTVAEQRHGQHPPHLFGGHVPIEVVGDFLAAEVVVDPFRAPGLEHLAGQTRVGRHPERAEHARPVAGDLFQRQHAVRVGAGRPADLRAVGEQCQGAAQRLATVQRHEQVRVLLPEIEEVVRPHVHIKHFFAGVCHGRNCPPLLHPFGCAGVVAGLSGSGRSHRCEERGHQCLT